MTCLDEKAVVRIFRFETDQIAEMWDVGQKNRSTLPTNMSCSERYGVVPSNYQATPSVEGSKPGLPVSASR